MTPPEPFTRTRVASAAEDRPAFRESNDGTLAPVHAGAFSIATAQFKAVKRRVQIALDAQAIFCAVATSREGHRSPKSRPESEAGYEREQPIQDVNDGKRWSEMDLFDLRNSLAYGTPIEEVAGFLCRSGTVEEVKRKAEELGLLRSK